MTKFKKNSIPILFLFFVLAFPSIMLGTGRSKIIDISTPEKTLSVFIQAFKTGNNKLLNVVLDKNAKNSEFNAFQVIQCPSPEMVRYEIQRFRVITKKEQYAGGSLPGDVEVYVHLIVNEALHKSNPACKVENDIPVKGAYLLRSFDDDWQIIANAPFWPYEMKKIGEQ